MSDKIYEAFRQEEGYNRERTYLGLHTGTPEDIKHYYGITGPNGHYQIVVNEVRPTFIGPDKARVEALKEKEALLKQVEEVDKRLEYL